MLSISWEKPTSYQRAHGARAVGYVENVGMYRIEGGTVRGATSFDVTFVPISGDEEPLGGTRATIGGAKQIAKAHLSRISRRSNPSLSDYARAGRRALASGAAAAAAQTKRALDAAEAAAAREASARRPDAVSAEDAIRTLAKAHGMKVNPRVYVYAVNAQSGGTYTHVTSKAAGHRWAKEHAVGGQLPRIHLKRVAVTPEFAAALEARERRANPHVARGNPRGAGKPFVLARGRGFDTEVVSQHDTRAGAVAAMTKKTGGYGPDSLMTQGYMILDVSPSGGWELFTLDGKKHLRMRSRMNPATSMGDTFRVMHAPWPAVVEGTVYKANPKSADNTYWLLTAFDAAGNTVGSGSTVGNSANARARAWDLLRRCSAARVDGFRQGGTRRTFVVHAVKPRYGKKKANPLGGPLTITHEGADLVIRHSNPGWMPGSWAAQQKWLIEQATKESAAQLKRHLKAGRARSTYRYIPPDWHLEFVEALKLPDEDTFKALKMRHMGFA